MSGDSGGDGDGDPLSFISGPWLCLFGGVALIVGTVRAAIAGQGLVALMAAVLALVLFGMSYVFFDRKRDS